MWFEANQDAVLCRDRQGNPANGLARRSRSRTRGSAGLSSHPTLHEPEVCGLRRAALEDQDMTATTRRRIGTLSLALVLGSANAAVAQREARDDLPKRRGGRQAARFLQHRREEALIIRIRSVAADFLVACFPPWYRRSTSEAGGSSCAASRWSTLRRTVQSFCRRRPDPGVRPCLIPSPPGSVRVVPLFGHSMAGFGPSFPR